MLLGAAVGRQLYLQNRYNPTTFTPPSAGSHTCGLASVAQAPSNLHCSQCICHRGTWSKQTLLPHLYHTPSKPQQLPASGSLPMRTSSRHRLDMAMVLSPVKP